MCFTSDQKHFTKGGYLKFNDGSSKLLSGHKFQDKYVALRAEKLLLYRDIKVSALLFFRLNRLPQLLVKRWPPWVFACEREVWGEQRHTGRRKFTELHKKTEMC